MGKLFLNLDAKEEKRLKWLVGFFVGTHVVAPTFKNRQEWDKEKIISKLQGKLFESVCEKFIGWVENRNAKGLYPQDEKIHEKVVESELLKTEIRSLIYVKIPPLAKNYDDERKGLTTRRLIKGQVTMNEWRSIIFKFDNQCAYCGRSKDITKDHIIPISKGGSHGMQNLLPACKTCNSSKSNLPLNDWYAKQPFYSLSQHRKIIAHMEGDVS